MTQKNIDIMNKIEGMLQEGETISVILSRVYTKRNLEIPYIKGKMNVSIDVLKLSNRTQHALENLNLKTINDVLEFANENGVRSIKNMGVKSCVELLEKILDFLWANMTQKEQNDFLVDTVERSSEYIRSEII